MDPCRSRCFDGTAFIAIWVDFNRGNLEAGVRDKVDSDGHLKPSEVLKSLFAIVRIVGQEKPARKLSVHPSMSCGIKHKNQLVRVLL